MREKANAWGNAQDTGICLTRKWAHFPRVFTDKSRSRNPMLVKDRAASGIGASTLPRVWHSIDWKATAHRVMKLMLRSRANLYAAVRRVTQDNPGKRTPGVDGQLARTATERDQLIQQMGR